MNIIFYGTRDYDQRFFENMKKDYPDINITFIESNL